MRISITDVPAKTAAADADSDETVFRGRAAFMGRQVGIEQTPNQTQQQEREREIVDENGDALVGRRRWLIETLHRGSRDEVKS